MKNAVFGLVLSLGFSFVAQAETQVFKMMDGQVAVCSLEKDNIVNSVSSKVISISMEKDSSTTEEAQPLVKISMVRCDNGIWVSDLNPSKENYTINGIDVEVSYHDFEMILVDANGNLVLKTMLDNLGPSSVQEHSFSIVKNKSKVQDLEMFVRAIKSVKGSNGYEFQEQISFGGFRVRLNN